MTVEATQWKDMYEPSAMMGAVLALSGIEGIEIAFHGPSGCYTIAGHVRTDQAPMGVYSSMRPSGITEDNLVMGTSMEKLNQLLKFLKATAKPKVMAIVNTDSTALTGDDLIGSARRFEKETGVPSLGIDAPGFKGWDMVGFDVTYKALLTKLASKDIPKKENAVNIISPYMLSSQNWLFDFVGVKDILRALGLEINCVLTRNTTIDDIKNFAAAKLNILLTNEDMPNFNKETEKLGVPNFGAHLPLPYGIVNTEEWVKAIAKELGKTDEARQYLKTGAAKTKSILGFNYAYTWLANLLMQKRVAVIGRAQFAASIARFLFYDCDTYPVIVALQGTPGSTFENSRALLKTVQDHGVDMDIYDNPPYIQFARAIKEREIDFVVGCRAEKALVEGMRIPHLSLGSAGYFQSFRFVPYPYTGFEGVLYLIQELGQVMADMFHEKDMWQKMCYKNI